MTDMESVFGKSYGLNQSNVRHPDWARAYLDEMKLRGTRDEIILEYLRKAKADGMREAADIASYGDVRGYVESTSRFFIETAIRAEADKIERGET